MLAPAYDLLSTKLLIPKDTDELALPMNGKKSKLRKSDFNEFASSLEINSTSIGKIHKNFTAKAESLLTVVENSFLCAETKSRYKELLAQQINQIGS